MRTNFKQKHTPGRQSLFTGVEKYIEQAYVNNKLPRPKIAGCTAQRSAELSFEDDPYIDKVSIGRSSLQSASKKGKLPPRFASQLNQSNHELSRARLGRSIFESKSFQDSIKPQSIPIFKEQHIRSDLSHYLDLSVANMTFHKDIPDDQKITIARMI